MLTTRIYGDLRELAAAYMSRESPHHTLRPTALVHEAYLKLLDQRNLDWRSRTCFFALAAQAMRRVLIDHARTRKRLKRGGDRSRILLHDELVLQPGDLHDVLAVDEALAQLESLDPRQAQIVELRFFSGMTIAEVAETLNISTRTVEREWTMARAWLRQQLGEDSPA